MISMPKLHRLGCTLATTAVALTLGGCVFDSPYWAQTFATTTTPIPIQTWTVDRTRAVKIECSKANHDGLYPFGGPEVWTLVTNITPSSNASYDPLSGVIYSAGKSMALPAACWYADGAYSPPLYMTALRATQLTSSGTTQTYYVFDPAGLECMGREIGRHQSWFFGVGYGCYMTYSDLTTALPYVRIVANTLGSTASAVAPRSEGLVSAKSQREPEASTAELMQRLASETHDESWAPLMEAKLRGAFDNAMPEGTQLMDASCRATMCRAEVLHRDAQAQARFFAALAPLGLFSNDGQRGVMQHSEEATGLRSTYFIAREGHTLAPRRAQ
jgi:hypothetical protein